MINLENNYYEQMLKGNYEVALAEMHADNAFIFARDEEGNTLLHYATFDGNIEIAKWLLSHGACPISYNLCGVSPVNSCVQGKNLELFKILLHKARFSLTESDKGIIFASAVSQGEISFIEHLLSIGYDSNMVFNSDPIIIWAIQSKSVECVRLLCDNGADVNAQNDYGMTALYSAAADGVYEIVKYLILKGAEVDKTSDNHVTPLMIASQCNHPEVIKILLESGADIENRNKDGGTALLDAIRSGCVDALNILIQSGADIDAVDKRGNGKAHNVRKIRNKKTRGAVEELLGMTR